METIKVQDLSTGYLHFGNKGSVWGNATHICRPSDSTTLCGLPMLSSNWARIWEHPEIGCKECIEVYQRETAAAPTEKTFTIRDVKPGELFRLKQNGPVYVRDGYDRSQKKFEAHKWDDINHFIYKRGNFPVFID